MSGITSVYDMATSYTADEVHELLRNNLKFVTGEKKSEGFRPSLFTTNNGVLIEVYPKERPRGIEESFGFRPSVRVSLELARGEHPGFLEGELNMVRVVNWLLNHVEGDAVLLSNLDRPVLLRRGNEVWLDLKDDFWRQSDLQCLTVPYEWRKLPEY